LQHCSDFPINPLHLLQVLTFQPGPSMLHQSPAECAWQSSQRHSASIVVAATSKTKNYKNNNNNNIKSVYFYIFLYCTNNVSIIFKFDYIVLAAYISILGIYRYITIGFNWEGVGRRADTEPYTLTFFNSF